MQCAELLAARATRIGLVCDAERRLRRDASRYGIHQRIDAFDLAQVARVAMQYPAFRELSAARAWTATGSRAIAMRNLNDLMGTIAGADGIKIGWTPGAGGKGPMRPWMKSARPTDTRAGPR